MKKINMHMLFYCKSLYFELLIFLFINNNQLKKFEGKKYTLQLKIIFHPLYTFKKIIFKMN
jgi:hypothetical protein